MILRPLSALPVVLLASFLPALADDNDKFDCNVESNGAKFNLNPLAGAHVVNRTHDTVPTEVTFSLRFNLCGDLEKISYLDEKDQCGGGTRACLTQVNEKHGEADRIVSVYALMTGDKSKLSFDADTGSSKSLTITSKGGTYPHPITSNPTEQSLKIKLLCTPDGTSDAKFEGYDGTEMKVEWKTSAACPLKDGNDGDNKDETNPPPENGDTASSGSGVGWFFLMLFLAFIAYFCIGAYYNYSTYGARGLDLIPHRDFWQEVPYMLRDVISHLCSSSRPRRASDRGYIAV